MMKHMTYVKPKLTVYMVDSTDILTLSCEANGDVEEVGMTVYFNL